MAPRILIVDDEYNILTLYQELLANEGYEVGTASEGEEGLKRILEGGWDLILLDIIMPKASGIDILKKLQGQRPVKANGKIIILTVLDDEQMIADALSLGAAGYLIKTEMTPDKVVSQVKEFLKPSG